MGLGNGNYNQGNKGSNWRYEYNVLKALECIVTNTLASETACCPTTNTKLDTIITSLSSIDAGIPTALGQTTMAASMSVTIANNQTAIPVSLPSGAMTFTSTLETGSTNSPVI